MSDKIKRSDGLKLIFDDSIIPEMREYANSLMKKDKNTCTWERCEDLAYDTNCGNTMSFSGHYTYDDNKFVYCPFCGGKINDYRD